MTTTRRERADTAGVAAGALSCGIGDWPRRKEELGAQSASPREEGGEYEAERAEEGRQVQARINGRETWKLRIANRGGGWREYL